MKFSVLAFASAGSLALGLIPSLAALSQERQEELLRSLRTERIFARPDLDLTREEKRFLIPAARELWKEKAAMGVGPYLRDLLVVLGDEQMLQEYVAEFRENPYIANQSIMVRSQDPRLVEWLAPDLFRSERLTQAPGDIPMPPFSFLASDVILLALRACPDFPGEVRAWADRGMRFDDPVREALHPEEAREILREWWRANEVHFEAQNYAAVRPGRELRNPEAEPEVPEARLKDAESSALAAATTPPEPREAADLERAGPAGSPAFLYLTVSGVVGALAKAWWWLWVLGMPELTAKPAAPDDPWSHLL